MKYRRTLVTMLALIMLITNTLFASEADVEPNSYVKVKTKLLLRDEPSQEGTVIVKMKPGELLYTKQKLATGWSKVICQDGTEGYAKTEYIVDAETDDKELISVAIITAKSSSDNRNYNMAKAAEKINGFILEPNEEFNWYGSNGENGVVGPASKENGYKEAGVIISKRKAKGYGGGVCQVSTAVYNCIYKLGIRPTEHHHHSLASSYVEKGMDATVSYPGKNFVFTNTKDFPIIFEAYTDGGQVIVIAYKIKEED